MAPTTSAPKSDTFTFRLDANLKAALTKSAMAERKQPGALVRDLVRDHVARRERRAFEEEARRQCLAINAGARNSESDEAQVMRELEGDLEAFADEWR